MKLKSFIAALLLTVSGYQCVWAQHGMQVWQNGILNLYYLNMLDSIQFVDRIKVWHDGKLEQFFVDKVDSISFVKIVTRIVLAPKKCTMWTGWSRDVLATALPVSADIRDVTWASTNPDVAMISGNGRYGRITAVGLGNAIITATATDGSGVKGECQVTVIAVPQYLDCPDVYHPHAIDLGLPSGTKWACCNIGALVPESYGYYYAWGETNIKSVYDFDNYQWRIYNDKDKSWEYGFIGVDIAGTEYDVATMTYPNTPWRMPTREQWHELFDLGYEEKELNGVRGCIFKGKNGGQIFLPAAGKRVDDRLEHAGQGCHYRSSVIDPKYSSWTGEFMGYTDPHGETINLYSSWGYCDIAYQYEGWSVRAVCKYP